jgi:protein ImuB
MRLACIYMPVFPLQIAAGDQPHLAGRAVVVLGGAARAEVVACSRAAFQAGVREGMSPSQARARVADLIVVPGSPLRWREELLALVADIGAFAPGAAVDLSEALRGEGVASHPVLFVEVPAGQRGERFGRRLLDVVTARCPSARVGIAADRFTARAAARTRGSSPVVVVSRAAAAAFLAPLSIDLLPLRDEVRALLRAAGVLTLGEFAALPPPSIDRGPAGAIDYQELARGNGSSRPFPRAPQPAARASLPAPRMPVRPAPRRRRSDERQLHLAS